MVVTALLSAIFLFGMTAVSTPGPVSAATYAKVALCSANLRSSASTSARIRASIKTGTKVGAVTRVTGSGWRATCAGKTVSGTSWFRIVSVNGKSVKSLYGVTYVYAATGLFKAYTPPPVTRYAACNAYLRTSASTTATSKMLLKTDSRVLVVATVTGGSWKTTCAGNPVAGQTWYRITGVNGVNVKTLFNVTYVYAASGLFKNSLTPSALPTPTPTPRPSATATPRPSATPAPTTPGMNRTEGIDVSHWQNTINWPAVSAAGKKFTYIKASESTDFVDPLYATNRAQAQAAGLYVGAYHFAQPSTEVGDAAAEADHYVDTATPASGDLLPVLDLERSGGLGQTALTAWVRSYLDRIYQRTGVRAVIYCSPSFWKNYLGDTTWFATNGYQILWIAHWTTASQPTVPGGAWGGNGWTFWQYTSDGSVPGISGRVDLNRYNGTDFTKVRIP
jgi:GH25 family lysozyme M1 (1,4-beta-N-acetylmuramidase)